MDISYLDKSNLIKLIPIVQKRKKMKTLQKAQDKEGSKKMTDRTKTALILGMTALFMFSPLAMSLFGHPIPMFQNLGFERETIAPPLAWILATITAIAYVLSHGLNSWGFSRRWSAASSKRSSFDVGPWICS
jgi:hypothetical protein